MKADARALPIFVIALAFSTSLGCGGAPSSGAASASAATPGAQCLAEAEAKREPKATAPDRISVKHVLVRYQGARGDHPEITRTREQACLRAEEALAKLQSGVAFADVVAQYSDETGAATREGSLGMIERGDVAPSFADAAFELQVREVSAVVETPFGFHLILRTE
jgi:parvulin-like peptidyl-prolyl cis-trans isomerase-like protein